MSPYIRLHPADNVVTTTTTIEANSEIEQAVTTQIIPRNHKIASQMIEKDAPIRKYAQIIGYASDVFEQEPITNDDPLLTLADHPRVIFSPHNAWGSKSAQETLWQILSKQVADFIDSQS